MILRAWGERMIRHIRAFLHPFHTEPFAPDESWRADLTAPEKSTEARRRSDEVRQIIEGLDADVRAAAAAAQARRAHHG